MPEGLGVLVLQKLAEFPPLLPFISGVTLGKSSSHLLSKISVFSSVKWVEKSSTTPLSRAPCGVRCLRSIQCRGWCLANSEVSQASHLLASRLVQRDRWQV